MTRTLARTGRWDWAIGAAFVFGALGIAMGKAPLVIAGTIPLWYVGYASLTGMAAPQLAIERSIDGDATAPGEHVSVELAITNDGEEPIADCRVIDGVPDSLAVADGNACGCHVIDPGETVTTSYAISARRGEYQFDEPTVRCRNLTGTVVAAPEVEVSGDTELDCELPVEDVPLTEETVPRTGRVRADEGGAGTEFFQVREYQRGDPMNAIDWRRYAKTDELTTVDYREERAATVVIVVDARDETFVSATETAPAAITLSTYAAERSFDALAETGHSVGLIPIMIGETQLVGPGTGDAITHEAHEELDRIREKEPRWVSLRSRGQESLAEQTTSRLSERLPGEAQVLLFTPALDSFVETVSQGLSIRDYGVTVVSPDVTIGETPAQQVMAASRRSRLNRLRQAGVSAIDWERSRPLPLVLGEALQWGEQR
jgi:uncharacterized protein (DUF58 family)